MKHPKIKYKTKMLSVPIDEINLVLETITNLDDAIDLLCQHLTEDQEKDPCVFDYTPYFGNLWPSSIALSKYLIKYFDQFRNLNIIELGCGLGLPSILLTKAGLRVTATDFHPQVEEYYLRNLRHNNIDLNNYQLLNWRESKNDQIKYDVIIGSDILYESHHPHTILNLLKGLAKPRAKIILADPGRSYLQNFVTSLDQHSLNYYLEIIKQNQDDIFILDIDF